MKKAVILHSIAVNGGDELLFKVLEKGLEKISNVKIIAKTTHNILSYPYLGNNVFLNGHLTGENLFKFSYLNRLISRLNLEKPLSKLLPSISQRTKKLLSLIDESDYVLLMPGGYLHEYYGFDGILKMVDIINSRGKPVYVFGHSLGPFDSKKANLKAGKIFRQSPNIVLRDPISAKYLKNVERSSSTKTKVTTDIAFAYNKLFDQTPRSLSTNPKRVLLNFREWQHGINPQKVLRVGKKISLLLSKQGYEIEYISTCQGVEQYSYNDADVANKIVNLVKKENPNFSPTIHTKRYEPNELLSVMSGACFYIGMRLHGAISAILANVPALNLGYEHKSEGVYDTIGLGKYTISINCSNSEIFEKVNSFIDESRDLQREKFKQALNKGETKAIETFKIF